MRKKSSDFDESEKVLAVVSAEIMKLVWPSEKITWDIPSVSHDNPYIGAIDSVKQGVFDYHERQFPPDDPGGQGPIGSSIASPPRFPIPPLLFPSGKYPAA